MFIFLDLQEFTFAQVISFNFLHYFADEKNLEKIQKMCIFTESPGISAGI